MQKLLFFLIILVFSNVTAQDAFHLTHQHCGNISISESQNSATEMDFFMNTNAFRTDPYIIPVVFHIIHQGGPENLTKNHVLNAINGLNKNFAGQAPNLAQMPSVFQNLAVDTGIEFRLATIDPNGNCTDGIHKVESDLVDYYFLDEWNVSQIAQDISNTIQWNPRKYLNIFVHDFIYGDVGSVKTFNGLATYPTDPIESDGIYIDESKLRFDPDYAVLAHEAGHWFNLSHIWADDGGTCFGTDHVNDTPNQAGPTPDNFTLDNFPKLSCDSGANGDMFTNFMDYGPFRSMFTDGQKSRMESTLYSFNQREQIWDNDNLEDTGVADLESCTMLPLADFTTDQRFISKCEDDINITFTNASTMGEASNFQWSFPGGTPATSTEASVNVVYPEAGTYQVQLIVSNELGSDVVSKSVEIYVYAEADEFDALNENFESINAIESFAFTHKYFGEHNWTLTNDVSFSGDACMMLENHGEQQHKICYLKTRKFDVTAMTEARLKFKLAYSKVAFDDNSNLQVFAYKNCLGQFYRFPLLTAQEMHVVDYGADFYPQSQADWINIDWNIPDVLLGIDDLQLGFVFHNINGNNVFIDNIEINNLSTNLTSLDSEEEWGIQPNPANNFVNVSCEQFQNAYFEILDIQGKMLKSVKISSSNFSCSLEGLSNGMYYTRIIDQKNGPSTFKKMLITK